MRLKKFCLVLTATIGCRASEKTLMPENEVNAALSVSAPTTVRLNDGLMFEVSFTNLGTSPIVMEGGWKHINTDFLREDTQKQVYSIPGPVQTLEYNPYTVPPGGTFRCHR